MFATLLLWSVVFAYAALILIPRTYWLVFGRRCPQCAQGRLSFQGLVDHPWRRLRSWWRCSDCTAVVHESRFGLLAASATDEETLVA